MDTGRPSFAWQPRVSYILLLCICFLNFSTEFLWVVWILHVLCSFCSVALRLNSHLGNISSEQPKIRPVRLHCRDLDCLLLLLCLLSLGERWKGEFSRRFRIRSNQIHHWNNGSANSACPGHSQVSAAQVGASVEFSACFCVFFKTYNLL